MKLSKKCKQSREDKRSKVTKRTVLSLAIAQAITIQVTQAANIEVTSNLDDSTDCTLREALATVNAGVDQGNGCIVNAGTDALGTNDTITFGAGVAGQTITLSQGHLPIYNDVSINPAGINTTIDANGVGAVIGIDEDRTVELDQLNLTGGSGVGIRASRYSSVTLSNSTVTGNSGYGMYVDYASAYLENSTVSGNSNTGIRSGIFGDVNLNNSTVSGNSGDGIHITYGGAQLANSTVSGNSGSGIIGPLWLTNTTVTGNSAFGFSAFEFANLNNSIVANNSALGDCRVFGNYGPGEINAGPDTISTTVCDGATVADPLLGPLADNGGPTKTHALLPGSPAIDNGTGAGATATDQRGVAAEGVRDSGAYEFIAAEHALALEKLINHKTRETPEESAELLAGTRYRVDYKVTNNSADRLYRVRGVRRRTAGVQPL